jgi:hypothetical protein
VISQWISVFSYTLQLWTDIILGPAYTFWKLNRLVYVRTLQLIKPLFEIQMKILIIIYKLVIENFKRISSVLQTRSSELLDILFTRFIKIWRIVKSHYSNFYHLFEKHSKLNYEFMIGNYARWISFMVIIIDQFSVYFLYSVVQIRMGYDLTLRLLRDIYYSYRK